MVNSCGFMGSNSCTTGKKLEIKSFRYDVELFCANMSLGGQLPWTTCRTGPNGADVA
jgi:hypothetical protein